MTTNGTKRLFSFSEHKAKQFSMLNSLVKIVRLVCFLKHIYEVPVPLEANIKCFKKLHIFFGLSVHSMMYFPLYINHL